MVKDKNKMNNDSEVKLELANRIAQQSKRVSTTYQNFEAGIFKIFRTISTLIDRILFNSKYSILVSLGLAILFYISINFNSDNSLFSRTTINAKELYNIKVNASYNVESFELSGLPTTANITIIGDASDVITASNKSGYVLADLDGLVEGKHVVKLKAVGFGDNVNVKVDPSNAYVTLKKKTTRQFDLSYDFINTDKLNNIYILGKPEFENSKVNVRASQDTLDNISLVKALIDVTGVDGNFTKAAKLVAYDSSGNIVNADIVPETVNVSVSVTSPSKTVPIVLKTTGELPEGMSIDSITMDNQTVTIYASDTVLNKVEKVTVELDASTLNKDTKIVQPIVLPTGVNSSTITKVNLDIKLGQTTSKEIEHVDIMYINNVNKLSLSVLNNQTTVTVIAYGTEANLAQLTKDDINAYIDLQNAQAGVTEDIPIYVDQNSTSFVKYVLKQNKLNVTYSDGSTNEDKKDE